MKDEGGVIKVEGAETLRTWRRYFKYLLNEENTFRIEEVEKVEGPEGRITEEVTEALKDMKGVRAPGHIGVTMNCQEIPLLFLT